MLDLPRRLILAFLTLLITPFVAMLGENELRDGTLTIKNLATQAQDTRPQEAAGAAILEALRQRG